MEKTVAAFCHTAWRSDSVAGLSKLEAGKPASYGISHGKS
jgi:hypothetical protein